jgi:hypothetical protein
MNRKLNTNIHSEENVVEQNVNNINAFTDGNSSNEQKLLVPNKYYKIISSFHNSRVGHKGIDSTLETIKHYGHKWKNMNQHIENFIKRCPICQKNSNKKSGNTIEPFTLASTKPMFRIAIDTIVNLPYDKDGYRHILVIIDTFSRWTELYKCKDLTADTAVDCIVDWSCRFGTPHELVSDNAPQFIADIVEGLTEALMIKKLPIHPYSHEENGMVERVNKEIKRHLKNIIFEIRDRRSWSRYLPNVQRIINASIHSATGYKPSEIIYGNQIDLNENLVPSNLESNFDYSLDNRNEVLRRHNEIVELARKSQIKLDANNKAKRYPKTLTEFRIGEIVLIDYEND